MCVLSEMRRPKRARGPKCDSSGYELPDRRAAAGFERKCDPRELAPTKRACRHLGRCMDGVSVRARHGRGHRHRDRNFWRTCVVRRERSNCCSIAFQRRAATSRVARGLHDRRCRARSRCAARNEQSRGFRTIPGAWTHARRGVSCGDASRIGMSARSCTRSPFSTAIARTSLLATMNPSRSNATEQHWRVVRAIVLARDNGRCKECGERCAKGEADVHHLVPAFAHHSWKSY